jgi:hypothetical protein
MGTFAKARLIKLLNLTSSDNDHEALLALRNAQKVMGNGGVTWESLFAVGDSNKANHYHQKKTAEPFSKKENSTRKQTVETPPEPRAKAALAKFRWLRGMFEFILAQELSPRQREFADGLHSFWLKCGRLTPNQQEALERTCASKGFHCE